MKNLTVILSLVLLLSQSCTEEDLCLIGSGSVNEYQLDLAEFESISLIGPVNLRIKQASDYEVKVDAEAEIFAELSYEVKNGTLEIGFKENVTCFETDYGVWVNVTIPDIERIKSSGVSNIVSDGILDLDMLELDISGTANVDLNGQVSNQMIYASGVVNTENFDLQTRNTTIDVSGSGEFEISCDENLDINVSGMAVISYKGIPKITQDVSGSLNLIDAN